MPWVAALGFAIPHWVRITNKKTPESKEYMYIEEVTNKKAYGWRLCAEVDKEQTVMAEWLWDYSPECLIQKPNTPPKMSWARTCIYLHHFSLEPISDDEWLSIPTIRDFVEPEIYRIAADHEVHYGDGGRSFLCYPVWVCENLPVPEWVRKSVTEALHNLEAKRQDRQSGTPVEDIIDPDLFPLRISEGEYYTRVIADKKRRIARLPKDTQAKYDLTKDIRVLEWDKATNKLSEGVKIRETYQWIPSIFHIQADGKVKIRSRIHNLPPTQQNLSLYSHIAKIFSKMLPMFAKMHLVTLGKECTLQVVVKAQRYRLPPNSTYSGRWHVEGVTENIVGVGVYYCEVDEELEGGNLKFRPSDAPQPWYDIPTDYEVKVSQGCAVVFSNSIPHRFRQIRNTTDKELKRTFINFFVVDPTQPLKTTKDVVSYDQLHKMLSFYVKKNLNRTLPSEIIREIIAFTGQCWSTKAAKEFRKEARELMKEDLSGWGYINWGNCGFMEFISARSTQPDIREVVHTDSDVAPSNAM